MKRSFSLISFLFISILSFAQPKPDLNLDFEKNSKGNPAGWGSFGNSSYELSIDSAVVKKGNYSAVIQYKAGDVDFKSWSRVIPGNIHGKKITLKGFIKTENVTDGYAGLWMRIDPSIAFDNMHDNGVKGTSDWQEYEITLKMKPEKTTKIVFGALLVGKGKMWIDDLKISVDGKDLDDVQTTEKNNIPANKDKEFDYGSGITSISLNENKIENLKTLGLIWGFLKYYHPNIAKGNYNWDYELFRILPNIVKSENKNDRDEILVKWMEQLGDFPNGKEATFKSSVTKIKPDLDWIKDLHFSEELTTALLKVKNAKRSKENFYVSLTQGVGNPEFKNEDVYPTMMNPDAGFRLLSLFRYWNMIQYYFPYKNLIEEDWKNVLTEFIPKINAVNNETDYALTILELIARIHDTHATIKKGNPVLAKYFGARAVPAEISFIENKAVVTGFPDIKKAEDSGLKIGDVLTLINNKSVKEILNEKLKYFPASNYSTQLRNIAATLLKTNDTILPVEFIRNGTSRMDTLKTYPLKEIKMRDRYHVTDTSFRVINNDIAYINNGSLKKDDIKKLWNQVKDKKGLIIDDRNYPSDFIIYELSNYLMPESIPFAKFTNGSIDNPGLFTFTTPAKAGIKNKDYFKGKVVILVNEVSQSSAEFHAMAYRVHPNATVIGSTTAGADGNVSDISLPGLIYTLISGIGIYYPDGRETQRVGIIPDIEIKPTIEGIKDGRDEVLEKAIELINVN